MMSGLIGVIAYTTNNQAFVKADTIVDIDFGTVFPGTVANNSFTMDISGSSTIPYDSLPYTIALVDTSGPGVLDIRPYLTVTSAEAEAGDGAIGNGVYTCDAVLNKQTDKSDTWDVKLFVPDTNGDYSCKLTITPYYIPLTPITTCTDKGT